MKNKLIALFFLLLSFSGFSQTVGYDIFGTQTNPYRGPYSILTLDTLATATNLKDLYARYRANWVDRYIAVAVSSNCADQNEKAMGQDDTITKEQMHLLRKADFGCNIDVAVDYIPENNLNDNPPRTMTFSLRMMPLYEAKFPGGAIQMKKYLKENTLDQLSLTNEEQIKLVKIRFNINEEGQVADAQVFTSSEEEQTNQLLLAAICNMPKWEPAKNAKNQKITQEFEFSIGTDLLRCDYVY